MEIPKDIFERVSALCLADREALLSVGHPFYDSRGGHDRIRVLLAEDTDWDEISELVTDSYRILAPKKLSARLDW